MNKTSADMKRVTRVMLGFMCPTAPSCRLDRCVATTQYGAYCYDCVRSIAGSSSMYAVAYADAVNGLLAAHPPYVGLRGKFAHWPVCDIIKAVVANPRKFPDPKSPVFPLVSAVWPRFPRG